MKPAYTFQLKRPKRVLNFTDKHRSPNRSFKVFWRQLTKPGKLPTRRAVGTVNHAMEVKMNINYKEQLPLIKFIQ